MERGPTAPSAKRGAEAAAATAEADHAAAPTTKKAMVAQLLGTKRSSQQQRK